MTQTKKMKTFKNLCLLFALMLGIAACSKEEQDPTQFTMPNTEGESQLVGSKDSIQVEFTIGADTEELRLAQSLNAEGVPVSPFMEEKDVVIRFAVRKQGTITYTDAICKKIPGESKATYKGVIRLPDLYSQYDSWPPQYRPPRDLSGHQIAGILLGEADGGTQFVEEVDANTVKTIEQTELLTAENDVVRSKVPYILDWMDFPLTTEGRQTNKLTLHFKPVGNLLRIQLNNQFAEAKTLQSFKISSNAFVTQAKFDFSNRNLKNDITNYYSSVPTTASGSPIETLAADYRLEKTYNLSSPIQVNAKSKSKWYYLWVMPLAYRQDNIDRGDISIRTQVVGSGNDGKEYNMLAICSPLNEGSNKLTMAFKTASTLATAFKGGKLPLWYIAEYDVAPGGRRLTSTHNIPDQQYEYLREQTLNTFGYFSYNELQNINVPGYYVPDNIEFTAIHDLSTHKRWDYFQGLSYHFPWQNDNKRYTEEVLFPGETNPQLVTSIYRRVAEDRVGHILEPIFKNKQRHIIYALRFEQCGERDKLTAYRYTINDYRYGTDYQVYPALSGICRFEVSSVFLGSGFTGDINTIATPSFWSKASGVVTRIFPLLGHVNPDDFVKPRNVLWEGTRISYNASWDISLQGGTSHISRKDPTYQPNSTKCPVRLIKNEFKTAK